MITRNLRLVTRIERPMDIIAQSPEEAVYGVWFVPTVTNLELLQVHSDLADLIMRQSPLAPSPRGDQ